MSRASQIRFLSHTAPLYDAVVRGLGFSPLWKGMVEAADPAPGVRCLDVCTGTAGVALGLAARGARVVGLDLSRGMLARAYRKVLAQGPGPAVALVRMDARRLGFGDGSFPLVTCCMALHEMAEEERARVLAEVRRVASARVIVADYRVPEDRLGRRVFALARAFEYLESDDFGGFVAQPMAERLEAAGLRIDETSVLGAYGIWSCRVSG